ncbi:zinc finger protein 345-like [Antennarius striatus]|uniref:zinc finger protein 345-like n=1 Tax=Antennarius striatus TaxID=241820 RepID=UPI0035AE031A
MFPLQTIEIQVYAVMETLMKAAVTELGTVLDKCLDNAVAAQRSRTPSMFVEDEEEESEATPAGFNEALTKQFASLMEVWVRAAVEKILLMFKVSECEAEEELAAQQGAGLSGKTEQKSSKPAAGRVNGLQNQSPSKRSSQTEKKNAGELNPCTRKDHIYYRADEAMHEEAEGTPTQSMSRLVRKDAVKEDSDATTSVLKIKTKRTVESFRCPSCDKSFALKCLMDRHYLTHSKPHVCSECGKCFAGLAGLAAHSRRHTGEKLYRCSDCGTEFAYKYTLDRHMRRHSLKRPLTHTCTLCENQFTGLLALQRHRCCALKKTFVCSLCPDTFECRQRLADHENLHSGDRDFICEMCGETFFSLSSLATHRVTHTQKENCCDLLGVGMSDPRVLKNHMSKHTGVKLFSCEVCGKGCSHQSALKHHMLTHTGERPYICETCGKRCSHASALQNHMRIHTGKKVGQPVCSVCGKKFRRTVSLKYHMSVHTGVKPYACDQCDKKFSSPSNLKLHMIIHSGEKMYGCNICGRRFTQSSSLKLHRRIHTGERPYRCSACGNGFMYSTELKKHQRSHLPDGDAPSEQQ